MLRTYAIDLIEEELDGKRRHRIAEPLEALHHLVERNVAVLVQIALAELLPKTRFKLFATLLDAHLLFPKRCALRNNAQCVKTR